MTADYPIVSKGFRKSTDASPRPRQTVMPWGNYLAAWGTAVPKQQLPSQTVLVVDDAALVLRSTCRILKKRFFIETAKSAEHAIQKLRTTHYYAVVSDYQMTGNDGIWLLSWVQLLQPHAIRVLVSSTNPKQLETVLTTGLLHSFVKKPLNKQDLLSALFEGDAPISSH